MLHAVQEHCCSSVQCKKKHCLQRSAQLIRSPCHVAIQMSSQTCLSQEHRTCKTIEPLALQLGFGSGCAHSHKAFSWLAKETPSFSCLPRAQHVTKIADLPSSIAISQAGKRNISGLGGVGVFHVKARRGAGVKKFGMSLEAQENQTFWWDLPGFLPGYPGGARKV